MKKDMDDIPTALVAMWPDIPSTLVDAAVADLKRLRQALEQIIAYADGSTDPGIVRVAKEALKC